MFTYQTYKMLHYFGFMLLFIGFGGLLITKLSGIKLQGLGRKVAFITHGLGLLFLLVAGFGMLARLQLDGIPPWIHVKLLIWILLGLSMAFVKRVPAIVLLIVIIVVAMIAPFMAIYKPF